jgi:hypothetical protein
MTDDNLSRIGDSERLRRSLLRSLERITKHLPNTTLDDPLNRITVDAQGKLWVTEDTTLVVLKGHLIIEAELIDICGRLLKRTRTRKNLHFSYRLKLVRALAGDNAMPEACWRAIEDLNSLRNKMAHRLEPKGFDIAVEQFFKRFDEIEGFRLREDKSIPEHLISCISVLCGALSSIGDDADRHASETGQL